MPLYALTPQTAERLKLLLGNQPGEEGDTRARHRGRATVLVKCTSATAAGADEPDSLCYPAVVLNPANDDDSTGPEELGTVWLTVWGTGGAETPTVDQVYAATLSGELEIDGDSRLRAHAGSVGGGGVTYSTTAFADYTITASSAWQTITGSNVTLAAGTYLLACQLSAWAKVSASPGSAIRARLYNVTAGQTIGNSFGATLITAQVINLDVYGSATLIEPLVLASSSEIRVEAYRDVATWTTSIIRFWSSSGGTHDLKAFKIS